MRFQRLTWQQIAPYVGISCGDAVADIAAEVQAGQAEAWRLNSGMAYMVTRIEEASQGRELVVIAFEGRNLRHLVPGIISQARAVGCRSIRYHTTRRGLERMLRAFGFGEAERVHRAVL